VHREHKTLKKTVKDLREKALVSVFKQKGLEKELARTKKQR